MLTGSRDGLLRKIQPISIHGQISWDVHYTDADDPEGQVATARVGPSRWTAVWSPAIGSGCTTCSDQSRTSPGPTLEAPLRPTNRLARRAGRYNATVLFQPKRGPWLAHCVGVLLGSDRQAPTERVSV